MYTCFLFVSTTHCAGGEMNWIPVQIHTSLNFTFLYPGQWQSLISLLFCILLRSQSTNNDVPSQIEFISGYRGCMHWIKGRYGSRDITVDWNYYNQRPSVPLNSLVSGDLGPVSIWRPSVPGMGIPILKIRLCRDRFIFNMGIPILLRRLYIETTPGFDFKIAIFNPALSVYSDFCLFSSNECQGAVLTISQHCLM